MVTVTIPTVQVARIVGLKTDLEDNNTDFSFSNSGQNCTDCKGQLPADDVADCTHSASSSFDTTNQAMATFAFVHSIFSEDLTDFEHLLTII